MQSVVEKVIAALEMRAKCLSSVDGQRKPTKEDMEDVLDGKQHESCFWLSFEKLKFVAVVCEALRGALSDEPEVFPLDVTRAMRSKTRGSIDKKKASEDDHEMEESAAAELVDATTHAAVMRAPGATYLDVRITKIGLKDASVYVNPTMAVSVLGKLRSSLPARRDDLTVVLSSDYSGKAMEETRETGVGGCSEPRHVTFDASIQLATNLRKMEDRKCQPCTSCLT
jgi:hypothetical protein